MSEEFVIEAEERTLIGKGVKKLRREGIIPAVIYGRNEPEHIQIDALKTRLILRDAADNSLLQLNLNGKPRSVLARDVQRHITRGDLIHVDFYEVEADTMVTAEVSLSLYGTSELEQMGLGAVRLAMNYVEIEAKPADLISEIQIDINTLKRPSDVIQVRDLPTPENVTITTAPDLVAVTFATKRNVDEVEAEEEEMDGDSLETSVAEDV